MFSSLTTATMTRGIAPVAAAHRSGISRVTQTIAMSLFVMEILSPDVSGAASYCGKRCVPPPPPPPKIISYEVTLNSLELVSTTGVKAEVLAEPVDVDLAQVIDLEDAINTGLI